MIGRSLRRVLPAALVALVAVCVPLAVAGYYTALDVVTYSFENFDTYSVVTVWVQNPTAKPLSGLVGVAATAQDGRRISGSYPLWVPPPPEGLRQVQIRLASPILNVDRAWVMRLAPPR